MKINSLFHILFLLFLTNYSLAQTDYSISYADKNKINNAVASDPLGVSDWKVSKENDNAFNIKKAINKIIIPYRFLREEDISYRIKIIREIPINEKMNLPFRYNIDEEKGNQRFIMLLLKGIKEKKIKAYSPNDDRFTQELNYQEVTEAIVGKPYTISITDYTDPSGNAKKDTVVIDEFNPSDVEYYRVKEEWIFDIVAGQLNTKILGIAPLKNVLNPDGSYRDKAVLFWIYYPNCREYLGGLESYNPNNLAYRNTWEEIWETKYYSSYIIKSSIQNPYNQNISSIYPKDKMLQLIESEKIKNIIFDFEQNMWSY